MDGSNGCFSAGLGQLSGAMLSLAQCSCNACAASLPLSLMPHPSTPTLHPTALLLARSPPRCLLLARCSHARRQQHSKASHGHFRTTVDRHRVGPLR
eukprot:3055314-Rhodomonas_salina.2